MDYFNQPRQDIPPFKSFADAVAKIKNAIAQLKAAAEYLDLTSYNELMKGILLCKTIAQHEQVQTHKRSTEYQRLKIEVGRNIAAGAKVREEIQKQVRALAFNPIYEMGLTQSIKITVEKTGESLDSLKAILATKRPLSSLRDIPEQIPSEYDLGRGL
jgi:hypothetical protein